MTVFQLRTINLTRLFDHVGNISNMIIFPWDQFAMNQSPYTFSFFSSGLCGISLSKNQCIGIQPYGITVGCTAPTYIISQGLEASDSWYAASNLRMISSRDLCFTCSDMFFRNSGFKKREKKNKTNEDACTSLFWLAKAFANQKFRILDFWDNLSKIECTHFAMWSPRFHDFWCIQWPMKAFKSLLALVPLLQFFRVCRHILFGTQHFDLRLNAQENGQELEGVFMHLAFFTWKSIQMSAAFMICDLFSHVPSPPAHVFSVRGRWVADWSCSANAKPIYQSPQYRRLGEKKHEVRHCCTKIAQQVQ